MQQSYYHGDTLGLNFISGAPEVFAIPRLEVVTEHNVSSSQCSAVMHINFTSRFSLTKELLERRITAGDECL